MLSGRKVLLVEDEPVTAMVLVDMLADLGIGVWGLARTLDKALAIAGRGGFDPAVMDIHLKDGPSYPAAERLAASGIPVVFVTGHPRARPPGRLAAMPLLLKPYGIHELAAALHRALPAPLAA